MPDENTVAAVEHELQLERGGSLKRHSLSGRNVKKNQQLYQITKVILASLYAAAIICATTVGLIGLTLGLQFTLSLPLLGGLLAAGTGLFGLAMLSTKTRAFFSDQLDSVLSSWGFLHIKTKGRLIEKQVKHQSLDSEALLEPSMPDIAFKADSVSEELTSDDEHAIDLSPQTAPSPTGFS